VEWYQQVVPRESIDKCWWTKDCSRQFRTIKVTATKFEKMIEELHGVVRWSDMATLMYAAKRDDSLDIFDRKRLEDIVNSYNLNRDGINVTLKN
jgi:hypothetical protein